jgi:hypothetical protein
VDPTILATALGVGDTVIVGVAGFWANVRNTSKATALTRRAIELTEQGQVTDRYTRAIEQLGSDKIDVRIGGIYALERVARDSTRDHPTVMEVLAAFVRENSHEPWRQPGAADGEPFSDDRVPETRPDVQAAVTIIGRRDSTHDSRLVDLHTAQLAFADLTRGNFTHANLSNAELFDADLTYADLTGAILIMAHLHSANLTNADLTDTDLRQADLTDTNLSHADLTRANLDRANLDRANLDRANLTGALWATDAPVPEGWQRDANSGRLKSGPH